MTVISHRERWRERKDITTGTYLNIYIERQVETAGMSES